jgi:PAS domain S-box-containing protein
MQVKLPIDQVMGSIRNKKTCHFYLLIQEGILDVAGATVTRSFDNERDLPAQGYLFTGKLWSYEYISELERMTNASITVKPVMVHHGSENLDLDTSNLLAYSVILKDYSGNNLAEVHFTSLSQFILNKKSFYIFTLIPILLAFIVGILFYFAFRAWITKPLKRIEKSLDNDDPGYLEDIPVKNKEFSAIAKRISASFEARKSLEKAMAERKVAEDRILKLSTALEQSSEVIVITDPAGKIEYVNRRFYDLTGYSRTEVIGQTPRVLKSDHHDQEFYSTMWQTISSGNVWNGEILNKKKNGELYWEGVSITPIFNNKHEIVNYLAVKEDITEKKAAQQKLQAYAEQLKESNSSKDKFFSILAHDLKSPFHSLLGYTDILANEYETLNDTERRKFIGILRNSTKNVYDLVENLLQWSRLQTGRLEFSPEKLGIFRQIEYAVDILRATALKKNISIRVAMNEEIYVNADKNMIRSVLQNLISNALKFTGLNGIIDISAKRRDHVVEVTISDNGIGMSAADIEKLFRIEVAFTRKGTAQEVGTGLGLILCKELITMHNGEIRVESKPENGSTFRFTLPAA